MYIQQEEEYKGDLEYSKVILTTMKRELISFFIYGPLDE